MNRLLFRLVVTGGILFGCAWAMLMFSGPRMRTQPVIRAYEVALPLAPPGIVPVEDALWPARPPPEVPSDPAQAGAAALAAAETTWGYYCTFCHGADGGGWGPVGESWVPRPADVRSAAVQAMSDDALWEAMLHGIGHDPVLPRVVAPEHRPYLVLQVRVLGQAALLR